MLINNQFDEYKLKTHDGDLYFHTFGKTPLMNNFVRSNRFYSIVTFSYTLGISFSFNNNLLNSILDACKGHTPFPRRSSII